MADHDTALLYAQLEERLRAITLDNEETIRQLDEVFYSAEQAKREINENYHRRRLERLRQQAAA